MTIKPSIFRLSSSYVAVAVLLGSQVAHAAGLIDLYRESMANDAVYAAARAQRDAVQTLVPQARGQLLPQIGFNYSRNRNDTDNQFNTQQGLVGKQYDYYSSNGSLNLTQALFRPQAWIALAQADDQVRQAEAEFRQVEQELILRLAQAYFDVLLAEDNVSLAQEQKVAIAEQLKQAKRYFEAGIGTVTDINDAQARYDTIQAQEIAARNTLEVKVRTLEQIVGGTHRHLDRLGPRLALEKPQPEKVEEWIGFSLANNPQLKAKEAALEVSEKDVGKSVAGHLPTVDIVAGRSQVINPSYSLLENTNWTSTVGIQLAVPLFAGGTTQGRVDQSRAVRERTRYELESVKRSTVLTTRQEYLNVDSGVAQVNALQQAVKSNEVALYSAQRGQEAGMRTSFDVLNAQQLLFTVRRDLAQARYGYVTSRLKLRSATGLLGEEDVQLVQSWLDK
jgi:outer membrane protein